MSTRLAAMLGTTGMLLLAAGCLHGYGTLPGTGETQRERLEQSPGESACLSGDRLLVRLESRFSGLGGQAGLVCDPKEIIDIINRTIQPSKLREEVKGGCIGWIMVRDIGTGVERRYRFWKTPKALTSYGGASGEVWYDMTPEDHARLSEIFLPFTELEISRVPSRSEPEE